MQTHDGPDDPFASWRTPAAYFYTLDLEGPELAWEYLRRRGDYRAAFDSQQHRPIAADLWGLRGQLEDPALDARRAHPRWAAERPASLHLVARSRHDRAASQSFSLWNIRGRKRIVHTGTDLTLTVGVGPRSMDVTIAHDLADGAPYRCAAPMGPGLRLQTSRLQAHVDAVGGRPLAPSRTRRAARAAVLHLRALQALDAATSGASHRDIAEAIFGADAVKSRWHADSELRAQLRHVLSRGQGFMRGGYLALAGVRPEHARSPGDGAVV